MSRRADELLAAAILGGLVVAVIAAAVIERNEEKTKALPPLVPAPQPIVLIDAEPKPAMRRMVDADLFYNPQLA